jgi:hypothetical protein
MFRRAIRCFAISGLVGVLVAIALWILGAVDGPTRQLAIHASSLLCPMMIIMLADPKTPAGIFILASGVLISNFVLYGLAGLTLFVIWTLFQRRA